MIRKATLQDIPQMTQLWLELMDHHAQLDPVYYEMSDNNLSSYKDYLTEHIQSKKSVFFVAEHNKKLIGHIGGWIEKRPDCFKIPRIGYVLEAIVANNYRKQGIGKRLTNELLNWFKSKNLKFVELRAFSENKEGIKAWEKMGFKENLKIMIKQI